ncbi:hypothetical protein [Caballeronia glebae]|uniref:hypothetical protein n=1 Tax=Caballeronia glebae TaxID=1777143 RepID=UPI0038B85364
MKKIVLSSVLAALVLSACGGGGGSDGDKAANDAIVPPPADVDIDAQGMYTGTNSNNDTVSGVVLDNGTYYFVYVNQAENRIGLVQGTATASHGVFSSPDATDFLASSSLAMHGSIAANYVPKSNLNGTFASVANGNTSFTMDYSTVYDQTPSLTAIAGTYTGLGATFRGKETVTFVIGADGEVRGSGPSGCSFAGNVKIHGTKNAYDTAITFGDKCPNAGETFTGIVSVNGDELIAAAMLPERVEAFVVAASK